MRVGVTGVYASGKGTVCGMFEKLGAIHIDTDIIAREIVEPGKDVYTRIISVFGKTITTHDGSLDRKQLASIVFHDEEKLSLLNSLTHPEILKLSLERSSDKTKVFVINTPLLFESGFDKYMDLTITVVAETSQSVSRGKQRDSLEEKDILSRLNNQISLKKKSIMSDYVIDNTGTIENTYKQVRELWKIITKT